MSRRSIQNHLTELEDRGFIRREHRLHKGSYTSDRYLLAFEGDFAPSPCAKSATGKNGYITGAKSAHGQAQNLRTNPVSINPVKEPVKETAKSILCKYAGDEAVVSFLEYRRKKKGGALTITAAKRLSKHLDGINRKGGDADDALGMAEEKGWSSVEPAWYFNAINAQNGGSNGRTYNNGQARGDAQTDEAVQRAINIGRAGKTQVTDLF